MIFIFAAVLLSSLGCDVAENDPDTGLNPGCNNAGVCWSGRCYCCTPDNGLCGEDWTCDIVDFPHGCYPFSGTHCTEVEQVVWVWLMFRLDNKDANGEYDIECDDYTYGRPGNSLDWSAQVQYVTEEAGLPGTVKVGNCYTCAHSSGMPCYDWFQFDDPRSGQAHYFQVDMNEYYDLSCGIDEWRGGDIIDCEANYDYGHSAYNTLQSIIGDEIDFTNKLNDLLEAEASLSNNFLGLGWTNTIAVEVSHVAYKKKQEVYLVPMSYYYIVHGHSQAGCADSEGCATRLAVEIAQYAVRCCADSDPGGWKINSKWGCEVFTNSKVPECYVTDHETATSICSAAGGRLCTKSELEYPYRCSAGGGCGTNTEMVWSSTEGVVSTQPSYYVVKGSTNDICFDEDCSARLESADGWFPVRCCSDSLIEGWHQNDGCSVYSQSKLPDCVSASWESAVGLCSSLGGRLCTKDELEADCAADSGCNLNLYMVWSSTGEPSEQ